ncbi:MAG TPA: cytochrome c oxidase assembly protein [Amycolatopsis sp.]|nr:cytochrome c oxidase assembly protein [Amycolatopsis sp.]
MSFIVAHSHGDTTGVDPADLLGTGLIIAAAALYLWAAARPSRSGRRWPAARGAAYLSGLVLLALALFTDVGGDHDDLTVHIGRHLVLMMIVAPLLVGGGPLRLLLRSLPRRRRMILVEVMQDPAVRAVTAGRWAGLLLTVDYYGSMAVYLHTAWLPASEEHLWLHVATHVYFVLCGVLFWSALLGQDPTGWRPGYRTKLTMTLVGVPANVLLGWSLLWRAPALAGHGAAELIAAAWAVAVGGSVLSVGGAAVVVVRRRRADKRRFEQAVREEPWHVAS